MQLARDFEVEAAKINLRLCQSKNWKQTALLALRFGAGKQNCK